MNGINNIFSKWADPIVLFLSILCLFVFSSLFGYFDKLIQMAISVITGVLGILITKIQIKNIKLGLFSGTLEIDAMVRVMGDIKEAEKQVEKTSPQINIDEIAASIKKNNQLEGILKYLGLNPLPNLTIEKIATSFNITIEDTQSLLQDLEELGCANFIRNLGHNYWGLTNVGLAVLPRVVFGVYKPQG
ncbi:MULTISPECIES: hypothetical protein [Providencia]|uniref:hypothetical protein n=1 Tax=Providencia TaxID=586 RepID=UPI001E32CC8B|nr:MULTISPECIES: hypothetical protein [Providencia]USR66292.1 hypothetical protein NFC79_06780 [Providencia stuartii]EJD6508967.1 hypothetical protein [Providencia rettgeri]ELR5167857.1 hypothetical protein [Providencia rettgeri]ELR5241043.1 hypothetical protein [Providencia rettgeri]MDL9982601.1 hypothetical protein [Providencia rettgeri]